MRLENHDQVFLRPACTGGANGGVHFRRVVAVVIDQHRRAGFAVDVCQRELAQEVKTTSGALEAFQRAQNGIVFNPLFCRYGHRRRRVQRVMAAWRVQRYVQFRLVLTHQSEVPLRAVWR